MEYQSISQCYMIGDNQILTVDQSSGQDKTCLIFARLKDNKFHVERVEHIEKQEDMNKWVNENVMKNKIGESI